MLPLPRPRIFTKAPLTDSTEKIEVPLSTHANLVNVPIANQNSAVISECLSEVDDDLLVTAARAGDHNAFVKLYERHSRKVLPKIYRMTKNREDAEDAFQDAVMRAFIHIKSFEGRSHFTSWLTQIANNSALQVLRKKRGAELSIDGIRKESENSRPWEPRDTGETPEDYCARRESEELLRNAIQRLPCKLKEVVELQHAREYSSSQVAEVLGISVAAAKSRLMRARRRLGRRLAGARPRNASKPVTSRIEEDSSVDG